MRTPTPPATTPRWCPDCAAPIEGDPMCCLSCGTGADHFVSIKPSPRRGGRRFGLSPDGPSPLLSVRLPEKLMKDLDCYRALRGLSRAKATREILERSLQAQSSPRAPHFPTGDG